MKLKVTAIREAGNLEKERIVMKAESSLDVGEYVLLQTGFREDSVNTSVFTAYWFPDKEVSAGDYVILYTKSGRASERDFNDVQSHFFYWGKSEPIWDKKSRAAVLLHAPDWDSFPG